MTAQGLELEHQMELFHRSGDVSVHQLRRSDVPLSVAVEDDEVTAAAIEPFNLALTAPSQFYPFLVPDELPTDYGIGLIVGASGSGKSHLLRSIGQPEVPTWSPGRSIAAHFSSAEEAVDRFYAVGLNSVPTWRLPYAVLSNGQRFRADLARTIGTGALIDEFTSVVDRNVAMSASKALSGWVERMGVRRMVLATCHRDVACWLRPDWVIDTDAGTLTIGQTEGRPQWYAQHIIGQKAGSLDLR